jgi:hypothetical protein
MKKSPLHRNILSLTCLSVAIILMGATAKADSLAPVSSDVKVTTHIDSEIVTNNVGIELNKKMTIEASSGFLWWKDSSDTLATIFQGGFCEAYKSCEKEGSHLAGGFEKMPSDCSLKNYDFIQQDETTNTLFVTTGSLHFKCEKSLRAVASK